jgi:hypothetical protein
MGQYTVGEAWVDIRPNQALFEQSLQQGLPSALNRVGQNLTVPVKANTSQWEADWGRAGDRIKERFGRIFEYAAIGGGLYGAFDIVKTGIQGVVAEEQAARQATMLFGSDGAAALSKWSDNSITALGKTKGAAISTADQLGNMLEGFGKSAADALPMAEQLTKRISDIASGEGKTPEDVMSTIQSALASGRTQALRQIIPQINDADLKAMAEKMGFIKPKVDDANVTKLKADLVVLNDEIGKAQKGGSADPQAVELAQMRVTAATNAHGEAVKKYGAASQAALTTQISLQSAEDSLAKTRQSSVPDQDKINQLIANRGVLQDNIDKAEAGSLDKLDQNQKSLALINLLMQDTTKQAGSFGGTQADRAAEAGAAWDTAKEKLATGLMPEVSRFSDWVVNHGKDINDFASGLGKFLGAAADGAGKLIGWFTDHPDAAKALGEGIATAFALSKLDSWGNKAKAVLNDAKTIWDKITGKSLPPVAAPTPTAAATVGEMTVGTLIAKSFIGGGGVPGTPGAGGPSEPVILGPDGKALPKSIPVPLPPELGPPPPVEPVPPAGLLGKLPAMAGGYKGVGLQAVAAMGTEALAKQGLAAAEQAMKDLANPKSDAYKKVFNQYSAGETSGGEIRTIETDRLNATLATHSHKAADYLQAELDAIKGAAYDQNVFLAQATALFQSEESDLLQAASIIYATRMAQNSLEQQTTGARGAQLNAGEGSVFALQPGGSGKGKVSHAEGWYGNTPHFAWVGDSPGGEAVLNNPQLQAVVAQAVASALRQASAGVGSARTPNVTQQFYGFTEKEVVAAVRRELATFTRVWTSNTQRGLPPLHGFQSS